MTCRYCRAKLKDEAETCPDRSACSARVAKRAQARVAKMVTKPYVGGFDPDQAYRDSEKGAA